MFGKKAKEEQRTFKAFHVEDRERVFASNFIRTAKYTPFTFLFLNLFEQFHRKSNVYFLIVAVLQFIPAVSSQTPTSWIPLCFVLVVNMIKEGIEDRKRSKMDIEINGRSVVACRTTSEDLNKTTWAHIKVGSVVLLNEGEQLPADIILLATSDNQAGLCFIETANLDGETNLKVKESVEVTHRTMESLNKDMYSGNNPFPLVCRNYIQGLSVLCEAPNDRLHTFNGRVEIDQEKIGVSNKQIIYRGCTLKNTAWVLGLVVFTGMETKLMQNASEKRLKFTTLDVKTNRYLIGIFAFLGTMCIIGGSASGIWIGGWTEPPFYLRELGTAGLSVFLNMITFLVLFSTLVPISLTVTMEVIKVGHALLINKDCRMVYTDPETGVVTPARARTSNLTEDLGRIEYIFSDKTGTLTQNVMEFMKCSVAGIAYGTGTTEIGRAAAAREGRTIIDEPRPANLKLERGNNFYDKRINFGAWTKEYNSDAIQRFFLNLAVCHTVMARPKTGDEADEASWRADNMHYQASSPDEEALVLGAKGAGFWFKRRNFKDVIVDVEGKGIMKYEVLNVNEFNSTRKRMSCVVLSPKGELILMMKGADSVIFERLRKGDRRNEDTKEQLKGYANDGLRTLVLSERRLTQDEYDKWNAKYIEAFVSTTNRDEQLDAVAELIERDMELVGATAIEDKLQDGVPQCIKTLAEANIQLWILTGDKLETAINIAMACNLIDLSMRIEKFALPEPTSSADDVGFTQMQSARLEEVLRRLDEALGRAPNDHTALVIDGYALEYALQHEASLGKSPGKFLNLTQRCKSVVCCRVSPKQKAEVVELVRTKRGVITLAIGDGANDVGMILKAHIGVGISGREGVQAVMSSDYSIAQFRYLQQLVLIHGRWDFQRISTVILYFFYKNITFAVCVFWFAASSGWSAVPFWDDYYQSVWNVVFTSLPIFAVATFDKDMGCQSSLHYLPSLYRETQSGAAFTAARFFTWCIDGVWTSIVVYFVPLLVFAHFGPTSESGIDDGKALFSFTSFAACHLACNLRLQLITTTWTWPTLGLHFVSSISYLIFSILYCNALPSSFTEEFFRIFNIAASNPSVYLSLFLTQVLALGPAIVHLAVTKLWFPTPSLMAAKLERKLLQNYAGRLSNVGKLQRSTPDSPSISSTIEYENVVTQLWKIEHPDSIGLMRRLSPMNDEENSTIYMREQSISSPKGTDEFVGGYAYSNERGTNDPKMLLCADASNPNARDWVHHAKKNDVTVKYQAGRVL